MLYRFECIIANTNSNKYFEIEVREALPQEKGEYSVYLRHSVMDQNPDLKLYFSGSKEEAKADMKKIILQREKYDYVPKGEESEEVAIKLGWTSWKDVPSLEEQLDELVGQ